jgi:hypothetical protein
VRQILYASIYGHVLTLSSFFQNIDLIFKEDYSPSNDDILHLDSTPPLSTLNELLLTTNSTPYRFLDLRPAGEMRKVVHVVDNATAVLFLVDISLYDEISDTETIVAEANWYTRRIPAVLPVYSYPIPLPNQSQ